MRLRARIVAPTLALASVLGACTTSATVADPPPPTGGSGRARDGAAAPVSADLAVDVALDADARCEDLLTRLKAEGGRRVTAYGLSGSQRFSPVGRAVTGSSAEDSTNAGAAPSTAAPAAPPSRSDAAGEAGSAPQEGTDFSGTNVQEAGVDEPDIVKGDGRRLFTAVDGRVRSYDVADGGLRALDDLSFGTGRDLQLLLAGDRLLVLGADLGGPLPDDRDDADGGPDDDGPDAPTSSPGGVAVDEASPSPAQTTVSVVTVDVSDPADLRAVRRDSLDGSLVSARFARGVARLVVSSPAGPELSAPTGSSRSATRTALARNRDAIEASTIDDWVPEVRTVQAGADGQAPQASARAAVDCAQVRHPRQFSGFDLLSVVTVDPDAGVDPARTATVQAAGSTVYASADRLYVATTGVGDVDPETGAPTTSGPSQPSTAVHAFDTGAEGPATYAGSGKVDGTVLNQFSLSEHEGYLRVATTVSPTGRASRSCNGGGGTRPSPASSQSQVAVLQVADGRLRTVGRVDGLGRGEEIKAVRFLGDVGYVVTFCQTDPLYTIDLSDPTNPEAVGELKVLGYSSYLHPAGEGRLIGIGQDATAQGRVTGTQVALYDVSNLADPKQVAKYDLPTAHSTAEQDHHAFLWWPAANLGVLPVQAYGGSASPCPPDADCAEAYEPGFVGALGLDITDAAITERGRIVHDAGAGATPDPTDPVAVPACVTAPCEVTGPSSAVPVLRAAVVGDTLYTVSSAGVQATDLSTFAAGPWAAA